MKLLEWMVANASVDVEGLATALGAVKDAHATIRELQPDAQNCQAYALEGIADPAPMADAAGALALLFDDGLANPVVPAGIEPATFRV